ncbi:MAG TPA: tRNA guanosine(34) transglycosylase Tgt [Polyangiaceae bacterium]|nr:tRNA guanosine(34) transglycosylase Tgt [Polyangiaceae bacterium]
MIPPTAGFEFRVLARDGQARRAILGTPHGEIDTPAFMPVGTQGSVKALSPAEVESTGARIVLGNTYHLMLRPGADVVASLGGLRSFARWPHAMLTDSGGFQAYSLSTSPGNPRGGSRVDAAEEGFTFKSHIDGSTHTLTPESAVRLQASLGADVQMQLDVCPPADAPRDDIERAVARTTRWAKRAVAVARPERQAMFGIVQGGCFADLRRRHAEELGALPFDGLALGGFSVGEPIDLMHEAVAAAAPALDAERPRYLMGVGTPSDMVRAIGAGVDLFDCVLPTRNARNGQALTRFGRVVVKQARWRQDARPIDERCGCACCAGGFSRAYLRHLFLAGEILALRLLSLHNLHWYGELVREARIAIEQGRYALWSQGALSDMQGEGSE